MSPDWSELLPALLAVTGWGALLIVTLVCRSAVHERIGLPLWRFLRRRGIWRADAAAAAGVLPVLHAELRCALCADRPRCLAHDKSATARPGQCPNAVLLRELAS
jgi:hypothetical protein